VRTPRHLFNLIATLLKPALGRDAGGSTIQDFQPSGTFKCRIQTTGIGPKTREVFGDDTGYTAVLYCGPEVDITDRDRVQVNGTVYKVIGVQDNNRLGVFKTVALSDNL